MWLARARQLVLTLWAGSVWTVGYVAAPTLFATLPDRILAGTVAGSLFRSQAWLTMACAVLMLALLQLARELDRGQRRRMQALTVAMLACTLLSYFGLQPMIAAIRAAAGPGGIAASPEAARFGMLHGVASVVFLVQSLLAGWLVIVHAAPSQSPDNGDRA
jgi:hypothetical protein